MPPPNHFSQISKEFSKHFKNFVLNIFESPFSKLFLKPTATWKEPLTIHQPLVEEYQRKQFVNQLSDIHLCME